MAWIGQIGFAPIFLIMEKRKLPPPTDAELEVLQVLWQDGPATVRQVNEKLAATRDVGYTTTLKIMQIMAEKGLVERDTAQRIHIYKAATAEEETQRRLLGRFVDAAFRGSAMKLVMQALGNHEASEDELSEIKQLIERIENGK